MDMQTALDKGLDSLQAVLQVARDHPTATLAIAGSGLALLYWAQQPRNLPPGPISLPLVGLMFKSTGRAYLDQMKLAEKYGNVFSYYEGER